MLKISQATIFYNFLLLILFIRVISSKSEMIGYLLILLFIVILSFLKSKPKQISKNQLLFYLSGLLILYFNYIYQLMYYEYNNLYFIYFFGSQIIFFIYFGFFIQVDYFIKTYVSSFLFIGVVALACVVVSDYIMIENGLIHYQLVYNEYTSRSYLTKPLGLFAQFSINSSYSVVFFLLYLHFSKMQNKKNNIFLFALVTTTIILQDSGTGYVAYFLLLVVLLYKIAFTKYILTPLLALCSFIIVKANLIEKISAEYILYLYKLSQNILEESYLKNVKSIWDILFGIDGNYNMTIDLGPVYMIAKIGLLFFLFYSAILIYMIYLAPSRHIRIAIIILAFTNLHYPALFYPVMNVLLPILFIYLLNHKRQEIITDINIKNKFAT